MEPYHLKRWRVHAARPAIAGYVIGSVMGSAGLSALVLRRSRLDRGASR